MKPQQLNLFTGKTAAQNIIDRCNSHKAEEKPIEMISIKNELKK